MDKNIRKLWKLLGNGRIIAITGPMFSFKSDELVRYVDMFNVAKRKYFAFKPKIDDLYKNEIVSKSGRKVVDNVYWIESEKDFYDVFKKIVGIDFYIGFDVYKYIELKKALKKNNVFAFIFDEAQFLNKKFIDIANSLSLMGALVIVAGLDKDFLGRPFGETMPGMLAISDEVIKNEAVCSLSEKLNANYTYRKSKSKKLEETGGADNYEARSRKAWLIGEYIKTMKNKK